MFVMTLIVRNEADIIADHLRHHLDLGADRFVVIDNGSTDGTSDILDDFARAGVVDVTRIDGDFDQAPWAVDQINDARARFRPDWISALDADEFFVPPQGETLASHLGRLTDLQVIRADRINVFGTVESLSEQDWRQAAIYRSHVEEGPPIRVHLPQKKLKYPFTCYFAMPKVVFRPQNFQSLVLGAHMVTLDPPAEWQETGLSILHFPIRSRARFIESVDRRRPRIARDPGNTTSGQYRRWIGMLDAGISVDTVMAEILPPAADIERLKKEGVISEIAPSVTWR